MRKVILQQAFEELQDAIAYYEEQQAGLGLRLKEEFDRHIYWIMGNSTVPRMRRVAEKQPARYHSPVHHKNLQRGFAANRQSMILHW